MKITIEYGREYQIKIDRSFSEDSFFYGAYSEAKKILSRIESENGISIQRKSESDIIDNYRGNVEKRLCHDDAVSSLFPEQSNIMVFSSGRGQGKSSVLHSFAMYLNELRQKNRKDDLFRPDVELEKEYYVLMNAIDPSALHERESIVRVVISEMFEQFRVLLDKYKSNVRKQKSGMDVKIEELAELFHQCYENVDYITGISEKNYTEEDELEVLAQIGDSRFLKRNIEKLAQDFLELWSDLEQNRSGTRNGRTLVILIDDADLAVGRTYQICEDIRNYLSAQNILVLMAADFLQVEYAIEQEYIKKYQTLITLHPYEKENCLERCHHMAARYIEKVFPEGHRIELPRIDKFISDPSEEVLLEYINKNGEDSLIDVSKSCNCIQDQLLKLIYQKTGIIFLQADGRKNPFLPSTLRELTHFVRMLVLMDRVELEKAFRIELSEEGGRVISESQKDALDKVQHNIEIIDRYFEEYWCAARLDEVQRGVIRDVYKDAKEKNINDNMRKQVLKLCEREDYNIADKEDIDKKLKNEQDDDYRAVLKTLIDGKNDPKIEMLGQAISIKQSIFLNSWATQEWLDETMLKELVAYLKHTFLISEQTKKQKLCGNLHVFNYECEKEYLTQLFPEGEKIEDDLFKWMRQCCEIEQPSSSYPDFWEESRRDDEDGIEQKWMYDRIDKLEVNLLDAFIRMLNDPQNTVWSREEKEEKRESSKPEPSGDKETPHEEKSNEYQNEKIVLDIKNMLINTDIQMALSKWIDAFFIKNSLRKKECTLDELYKQFCEELDENAGKMLAHIQKDYRAGMGYLYHSLANNRYALLFGLTNKENRAAYVKVLITTTKNVINMCREELTKMNKIDQIKEVLPRIEDLSTRVADMTNKSLIAGIGQVSGTIINKETIKLNKTGFKNGINAIKHKDAFVKMVYCWITTQEMMAGIGDTIWSVVEIKEDTWKSRVETWTGLIDAIDSEIEKIETDIKSEEKSKKNNELGTTAKSKGTTTKSRRTTGESKEKTSASEEEGQN